MPLVRIGALDSGVYPLFFCASASAMEERVGSISESLGHVEGTAGTYTVGQMLEILAGADGADRDVRRIGEQLFSLVDQGPIRQALRAGGVALGVPPALRSVPWETICADGDYLHLQQAMWRGDLRPPSAETHPWPLRMLVVVGSAAGDQAVMAEDELQRIALALAPTRSDIAWSVVERCSLLELQTRLRAIRPHIVHFIGHGNVGSTNGAALELRDRQRPTSDDLDLWTVRHIPNDFAGGPAPRLVVLNACRSAEARDAKKEAGVVRAVRSVADAFLSAGVRAVVGMQTVISGPRAARFSAGFYRALAEGQDVSVSVRAGRNAAADGEPSHDARDWFSPVLELRDDPRCVVHVASGVQAAHRDLVKHRFATLGTVGAFVDRRDDRFHAWDAIYDRPDSKGVLVISGEATVGKSSFALWTLERGAFLGHQVRHVDLKRKSVDIGGVLRAIRTSRDLSNQPFDDEAFRPFDDLLARHGGWSDEAMANADTLITAFAGVLRSIAAARPEIRLAIVLDHFEANAADELFRIHVSELARACLRQGQSTLRVVLVATASAPFGLDTTAFDRIALGGFSPREYSTLTAEFTNGAAANEPFTTTEERQRYKDLAAAIFALRRPLAAWPPSMFDAVHKSARQLARL